MQYPFNQGGFVSIPVIIGMLTVIVFSGIVIASLKQEQKMPAPIVPEIETHLDTVDTSVGIEEPEPQEAATSTAE